MRYLRLIKINFKLNSTTPQLASGVLCISENNLAAYTQKTLLLPTYHSTYFKFLRYYALRSLKALSTGPNYALTCSQGLIIAKRFELNNILSCCCAVSDDN